MAADATPHPDLLFPWHKDNETLELFDRLCDEGADSVEEKLVDRRSID